VPDTHSTVQLAQPTLSRDTQITNYTGTQVPWLKHKTTRNTGTSKDA